MSTTEPTPELLEKLFLDRGMTRQDIADKFDESIGWVVYRLRKHEIRKVNKDKPWEDEEKMRELYEEERLSSWQIADKFDCSQRNILNWLEEHEIDTRTAGKGVTIRRGDGSGVTFRIDEKGHAYLRVNEDGTTKQVGVHRLQAAAKRGIEAVKDKHIHHANHCGWDNRDENYVVLDGSVHLSYHARIREGHEEPPWITDENYDGYSTEDMSKATPCYYPNMEK